MIDQDQFSFFLPQISFWEDETCNFMGASSRPGFKQVNRRTTESFSVTNPGAIGCSNIVMSMCSMQAGPPQLCEIFYKV